MIEKPNFFIVGAPKCGTTSLAMWINEHPNGFITDPKEPGFFNTDIGLRRVTQPKEYDHLYEAVPTDCIAIGEASTNYLQSSVAAPKIMKYQPEAKIIVMLRNPLEIVISLHNQELRDGNENLSDFESAWRIQKMRSKGEQIPASCSHPSVLLYRDRALIGSQLSRIKHLVPQKQLKIVFMEDLVSNPMETYQSVLRFLNLPYDGRTDFKAYNYSREYRSPIFKKAVDSATASLKKLLGLNSNTGLLTMVHRFNIKRKKRSKLTDALLADVKDSFSKDISMLGRETGRDLSHWLDNGMVS